MTSITETRLRNLVAVGAIVLLAGCTDAPGAKRVLEDNGYTDIRTGGYAAFSCDSRGDDFATAFTATAPNGRTVSGAVCKGWLKGSTIRFY